MNIYGTKGPNTDLGYLGIERTGNQYWNLSPEELTDHTIKNNQGELSECGALVIKTGKFTGRSPKDRFVVQDDYTNQHVDWGEINIPFSPEKFDSLYNKVINYMSDKDLYIRDCYACADPKYRLNVRLVSEYPWENQFAYNMFLRPDKEELDTIQPDWTILAAPGFLADPAVDGTRAENFAVINFSKKQIIIGGTAYTGEIKKGIFSVLNFTLPVEHGVLSMHCSSNIGKDGDTALFFGLSGTGKTTLSADENRGLIGDDEHGWSENSVFNFEGGCYAKTIDLSPEKEPQIFKAIKPGAILENVGFIGDSKKIDYADTSITQNTRVSYPIYHIDNAVNPSVGGIPTNIFFLTYDAFGVLPPISRLNEGQAMYHFISGYTSKVAGTEEGINEPQTTFSACFGSPFLPLHPTKYAEMLGKKIKENKVNVWLINTGMTGGKYGVGSRMSLPHTRALITNALNGDLNNVEYERHPIFGVEMPKSCEGVPSEILNPRSSWEDKEEYDQTANQLAKAFNTNFEQFADKASEDILNAAPKLTISI